MCSNTTSDDLLPCPTHHTHPYHFSELELGSGSNQQPYFRALVFFNKKPGLTDEFFHEHWKSVHADLTMQVEGAGLDLVRYVQFHQEFQHKVSIEPLLEASGGTMQIAPYDGCAEFHAESVEKFVGFMKNVYASSHLLMCSGCGTRFVDLVKGYNVMVGYDNLIFGRGIPGVGSDAILAEDTRLNMRSEGKQTKKAAQRKKVDSGTEEAETGNAE
ncbi:hypothetical protein EJ02DRAFT_493745 [Clathrospora elynae]|uniref:EthD domain-containing protein n=1 Tax=Clathrospora elynae TaxID=706981 RepID=A0A6A5T0X2_9PLEO|nr:hypothetical protein EJ02DRAFT_493745 [Clathrospora elynae]